MTAKLKTEKKKKKKIKEKMEHVYEESDDDTDSFCSDDFYSDDPNILSQDWLEECLTKEVKEIFVEKIFEYEAKSCNACQKEENKGHVCFSEFKSITCIEKGAENPAYRFANDIVEELLDNKTITKRQTFSLLALCDSNRLDFPYWRLIEWKDVKKQ